jgi:GTP-binding protein
VRISDVILHATVADHREGPKERLPQVAFAGRSNVGKSSLLNVLFGRRLAAISKQPGKTRTINYYLVNRELFFVDLPGYGYARVAKSQRVGWGRTVTDYLREEERLRLVVGLVDPRIPTSPLDVELVRFVKGLGRSLMVVMTKADRLGRGALAGARRRLERELELGEPPLAFSARTGEGKAQVLAALGAVAGGGRS